MKKKWVRGWGGCWREVDTLTNDEEDMLFIMALTGWN